ncbi:Crp/Fnr family transcriptional regulator [Candidatus Thiosymbion oneisti]|uniref:Crp/Fnr family transcriptional regulator n=1 Tax=Candidatus Thiosymbion oneisti TaxID=589554 RepID=UPI000B7CA613|nr:Crp/Fnr family transcriptional regulator [Candidatus Thiosymbion oneisti]
MSSQLEDIKAKAMADLEKELKGEAPLEPTETTSEPGTRFDAMGRERIQQTKKHMEHFCRIPFLNDLSDAECNRLAEIVTVMRLQKGDILIEQGKKDDSLYVLIEGRLRVNRSTGGGSQVTLACIREGEMAGEMGFLDDSEHSATLQADDTSEILQINRNDLEGLLEEHPQTVYKLMRAIAREVHKITQRMNMQFVEMSNYIHHQQGRY